MKKALRTTIFFILTGMMAFSLAGCKDPATGNNDDNGDGSISPLSGNITISPSSGVTINTELTANYSGSEAVSYQWKKDGINVGTNSRTYMPTEAGSYSVTVSATGRYNKTSAIIDVTDSALGTLSGNISISPSSGVTINTGLTANYSGAEAVNYQWRRDGINVGTNANTHTPTAGGGYTVTVSADGYNPKTSSVVTVIVSNDLSGEISISPSGNIYVGTQLTATYNGAETVSKYQWKKDGANVGTNARTYTPTDSGSYTVTVSVAGFNSKISSAISILPWNTGKPIITSIFSADPSAHVWPEYPDRLFLYPSQDVFPAAGCNLMDQYHVYSTTNMVDWVDHGEILRRDDLPTTDPFGPHHPDAYFMWAPDAAYNPNAAGGKGPYFFCFPHSIGADGGGPDGWGDNWKLFMAWSDNPYSGFKDNEVVVMKYKNGTEIKGTGALIDPCIFQDGDDYYLVTGGSQQFRIAKLEDDMVTLAEDFHVYSQSQLPHYHEGPWMFTRVNNAGNKLYYLMYPGGLGGGRGDDLLYAISASPYGPWSYRDSILDPVGTGDTSHGSIVKFNDKWYLFYHNAALPYGAGNLRSVCVDELFFNADGTIRKVIQTRSGPAQNGPNLDLNALDLEFGAGNYEIEIDYNELPKEGEVNLDDYTFNATYNANAASGVTIGGEAFINSDGAVGNMHLPGTYIEFTAVSGASGGKALLQLDYAQGASSDVTLLVAINSNKSYLLKCPPSGGWSIFKDNAYCLIDLSPGTNVINLKGAAVNIKSISIWFKN